LINFDIELRGLDYVFGTINLDNAIFSIVALNIMECLKFNRLEIYKFMAFNYCSFKTSYVFLGSM
ncbi:hypothetical protein, partial [Mesomycoplasma ovipneumoniae]|uniref:hypothetical protein n=1 Tax=Mesomycoplasma ovipneumoniae TaxID=29562 RepID=UPI001C52D16A